MHIRTGNTAYADYLRGINQVHQHDPTIPDWQYGIYDDEGKRIGRLHDICLTSMTAIREALAKAPAPAKTAAKPAGFFVGAAGQLQFT